jgi:hypothetical protein
MEVGNKGKLRNETQQSLDPNKKTKKQRLTTLCDFASLPQPPTQLDSTQLNPHPPIQYACLQKRTRRTMNKSAQTDRRCDVPSRP